MAKSRDSVTNRRNHRNRESCAPRSMTMAYHLYARLLLVALIILMLIVSGRMFCAEGHGLPTLYAVNELDLGKSAFAEPDERDADANDKHSGPAAGSYAFPQEQFSAERPGRIVQRGDWDDEANVFDGKHCQ